MGGVGGGVDAIQHAKDGEPLEQMGAVYLCRLLLARGLCGANEHIELGREGAEEEQECCGRRSGLRANSCHDRVRAVVGAQALLGGAETLGQGVEA